MRGKQNRLESVYSDGVQDLLLNAKELRSQEVLVGGKKVSVPVPFPSPADWRDQWIYFIMVDRFNNPDAPPRHRSWNGKCGSFQGGNINGIRAKLDYLEQLGVGAVWLTPVFKNCPRQDGTYHGYGFQDLLAIDPRFGTEDDLRNLVYEAHARNIYVIFDIVLNHAGDVFAYEVNGNIQAEADWSDRKYQVRWRDENDILRPDWKSAPADCHCDAAVHPVELRNDDYFRQQGKPEKVIRKGYCKGAEPSGDFCSLKELDTGWRKYDGINGDHYPVRNILIRAYQLMIAKFDVDGFRIDTLKYVEPEFARVFGNTMREYALSIGKKNFFTFGEVADEEAKIREYVGRDANRPEDLIGVDAALDFPLCDRLNWVVKGEKAPCELVDMFNARKEEQKNCLSSHGEASQYFVTFLDNHDKHGRFYYIDPRMPHKYDPQLTLGIALLFALQGIPCIYYGTEQGLCGRGDSDQSVREALWGKLDAFDVNHPFFRDISAVIRLHAACPALRYGRQYFRPVAAPGGDFGISVYPNGVVAFSRILGDTEILIAANTQTENGWSGNVLIDFALSTNGAIWQILYSNIKNSRAPGAVLTIGGNRALPVTLAPMEIQILSREIL
ncbi:MAG: alpha-amylase family glycosyl hydrolase [Victivallaceae bacterium]|nr:alpha-amylase family glycosyl hydrolase [Victivallaceae bacterium]